MSTKTKQYAIQSLAACGFAVMRSTVAWQLRPDIWSSAQECGMDFSRIDVEGAQPISVTLAGIGIVPVLARSLDRLAERIEWITGHQVLKVEAGQTASPTNSSLQTIPEAQKATAKKLENTRALAAQEPPLHDCPLRREILAARRELS